MRLTRRMCAALASCFDAECAEYVCRYAFLIWAPHATHACPHARRYAAFGLAQVAAIGDARGALVRAGAVAPLLEIMRGEDAAELAAADAAAPTAGSRDAAVAAAAVADARRFASVALLKLADDAPQAGAAGASQELTAVAAAVVREGGVPALMRIARTGAGAGEPEMQYVGARVCVRANWDMHLSNCARIAVCIIRMSAGTRPRSRSGGSRARCGGAGPPRARSAWLPPSWQLRPPRGRRLPRATALPWRRRRRRPQSTRGSARRTTSSDRSRGGRSSHSLCSFLCQLLASSVMLSVSLRVGAVTRRRCGPL